MGLHTVEPVRRFAPDGISLKVVEIFDKAVKNMVFDIKDRSGRGLAFSCRNRMGLQSACDRLTALQPRRRDSL
ncbi:protein of unknown function [Methylocaldum szegediense]|uniref:Uncharacterized protein n=1 Tax=Methylocaldum szegediense TaxID=73780 RepID=A0ABN8WYA0_9GAMM|nr:protein of unknown function [Methylocaldum szegediense]